MWGCGIRELNMHAQLFHHSAINLNVLLIGMDAKYKYRVFSFLGKGERISDNQLASYSLDLPHAGFYQTLHGRHQVNFFNCVTPMEPVLNEGFMRNKNIILLCPLNADELSLLIKKISLADKSHIPIIASDNPALLKYIAQQYPQYSVIDLKRQGNCLDKLIKEGGKVVASAATMALHA